MAMSSAAAAGTMVKSRPEPTPQKVRRAWVSAVFTESQVDDRCGDQICADDTHAPLACRTSDANERGNDEHSASWAEILSFEAGVVERQRQEDGRQKRP